MLRWRVENISLTSIVIFICIPYSISLYSQNIKSIVCLSLCVKSSVTKTNSYNIMFFELYNVSLITSGKRCLLKFRLFFWYEHNMKYLMHILHLFVTELNTEMFYPKSYSCNRFSNKVYFVHLAVGCQSVSWVMAKFPAEKTFSLMFSC